MEARTQSQINLTKREIEAVKMEICRLAAENQSLDWLIPSEYDRLLRNVNEIELLDSRIDILKAWLRQNEPNPFQDLAKQAVAQIFAGASPLTDTAPQGEFKQIRRGHLTLVHSRRSEG